MRKKSLLLIVLIAIAALSIDQAGVFAQQKDEAQAPRKMIKDMTAEELVATIGDMLDSEDGVLDLVPVLKKRKDDSGKYFYVYIKEGREIRLDGLDKKELENIFSRVSQAAVQIRTERIQRQLESIQQAVNAQRAVQNIQRITVPAVQAPPRPPQTPPSQYQVPKPPPAPPKK